MARRSTSAAASPSSWSGMHDVAPRRRRCRTAAKNGSPWVWSQCRWPSSSAPAERRAPEQRAETAQPGAGVEHERRRLAVAWRARRTTCCRRSARSRARGRGRPPHAEHVDPHERGLLLPPMALADLGQLVEVELRPAALGDLAGASRPAAWPCASRPRARPARRSARPGRAWRSPRRRPHLDDAVEQQEDLVAWLALLGEQRRPPSACGSSGFALAHDHPSTAARSSADSTAVTSAGESSLAPRACACRTRGGTSSLKSISAGLGDELAVGAVHPVAGERAGADQLELGPTVGVDRERQRGPGERRGTCTKGGWLDPAGGGHAGAAAGRLREARPSRRRPRARAARRAAGRPRWSSTSDPSRIVVEPIMPPRRSRTPTIFPSSTSIQAESWLAKRNRSASRRASRSSEHLRRGGVVVGHAGVEAGAWSSR